MHALQRVNVVVILVQMLIRLQMVHVLRLDHLEQVVALRGRQRILESVRGHELRSSADDLFWGFIMGARGDQRALGASLVHHELTLQLDSGFLELGEAFLFEELPDFILGEARTTGDQFALLVIQAVTESRDRRSVIVPERAKESDAKGSLEGLARLLVLMLDVRRAPILHASLTMVGRLVDCEDVLLADKRQRSDVLAAAQL